MIGKHTYSFDLHLTWDIEAESDGDFAKRFIRAGWEEMDRLYRLYLDGQEATPSRVIETAPYGPVADDPIGSDRYLAGVADVLTAPVHAAAEEAARAFVRDELAQGDPSDL